MSALRRGFVSVLVASILAVGPGCSGDTGSPPPEPALTITYLGWYEESIDPSYWTSPPPDGQTAFYDFWIHYSGDIAYEDIDSARVYTPKGSYWVINRGPEYFSAANKTIGGWGRWYGSSPNLLPIGTMRAEVRLTNGQVATLSRLIPAPASATTGGFTSMYSEDVLTPPSDAAPMIRRARMGQVNTHTAAAQTIRVAFSVADSRVYSGWVWLYDDADAYLGASAPFRDPATDVIAPLLDGTLRTDGAENAVTFGPADVWLDPGATFDRIAKVRVVLTDGEQYASLPDGGLAFDCRSVGPRTSLTIQ